MAFGDETLMVGVVYLSLGAQHDGVVPGSFNHDDEKVRATGAVDFCTVLIDTQWF